MRSLAGCRRLCYQRFGDAEDHDAAGADRMRRHWRRGGAGPHGRAGLGPRRAVRGRAGSGTARRSRGRWSRMSRKSSSIRDLEAVVECAGHQAVRDSWRALPRERRRPGADVDRRAGRRRVCESTSSRRALLRAGRRLTIASAGIGALDILGAAAVGGLARVADDRAQGPFRLVGHRGGAFLRSRNVARTLGDLRRARCARGPRAIPQNVNISAAVALAGLGLDRTAAHDRRRPDHPKAT